MAFFTCWLCSGKNWIENWIAFCEWATGNKFFIEGGLIYLFWWIIEDVEVVCKLIGDNILLG